MRQYRKPIELMAVSVFAKQLEVTPMQYGGHNESKEVSEDVMTTPEMNVAQLIVKCLENEAVKYVFGIPGEENIRLVDAINGSSIRYILVRHEQGASFMADIYGRLTGKAGVWRLSFAATSTSRSINRWSNAECNL